MTTPSIEPHGEPAPIAQPSPRRFGWLALSAWMLVVYLLVNFVLPGLLPSSLDLYLVQPLLWLSLAGAAVALSKIEGRRLALLARRDLLLPALMLGGIQVAAALVLGLLLGFGRSPYARELVWVALNLWFAGSRLAGVEAARAYLGAAAGARSHALGFVLAWLLPLLLVIPPGKFIVGGGPEALFPLVGGTLLPAASESVLAAFLATAGGPLVSFGYRGVLAAFEWLSPILPDLPWLAGAFVNVIVPVLGLIALTGQEPAGEAPKETAKKPDDRAPASSWLLVGVLAVALIWLNSGAFGVRPSLISGNSMNPRLYPGDIVVTRTIAPEEISVGDIVRFHRDGIDVVHRVVSIDQQDSRIVFTTRGDNNNVDDEPVPAELVQGKLVLSVPKIGWISIYLRQALSWIGGAS